MNSGRYGHHRSFAVSLALRAGAIMKKNFTIGMRKEWKSDDTPLTKTDSAINDLAITEIHKCFPGYGVISEEGSSFHNEEYVWVCDPVDGTTPFSHGYPLFMFSLALVKNGRPVLGVLFDPILERLVVAGRNEGAFLNDKLVKIPETVSLVRALVSVDDILPHWHFNDLRDVLKKEGCILPNLACLTYSCFLVALGEFAGAVWHGKTPWDGAAVQIIMEEAGGICTDVRGFTQRYDREINGVVVGNKHIHSRLIEMIKETHSF